MLTSYLAFFFISNFLLRIVFRFYFWNVEPPSLADCVAPTVCSFVSRGVRGPTIEPAPSWVCTMSFSLPLLPSGPASSLAVDSKRSPMKVDPVPPMPSGYPALFCVFLQSFSTLSWVCHLFTLVYRAIIWQTCIEQLRASV